MQVEKENYSLSTFIIEVNVACTSIDDEADIFEQYAHRYQLQVAHRYINHW